MRRAKMSTPHSHLGAFHAGGEIVRAGDGPVHFGHAERQWTVPGTFCPNTEIHPSHLYQVTFSVLGKGV